MPTHRSRSVGSHSSPRRKGPAKQQSRQAKTANAGAANSVVKAHATARAKKSAVSKSTSGSTVGVLRRREEPFSHDPRVLEAAYRAFERLPRPRYLH